MLYSFSKNFPLFKGLKLFRKTSGVFITILISRIVYQYFAIFGINSLKISFYNIVIAMFITFLLLVLWYEISNDENYFSLKEKIIFFVKKRG